MKYKKIFQSSITAKIFNGTQTLILSFLLILCFACSGGLASQSRAQRMREWFLESEKVKVLSTTAMLGDIVEKVGGKYVANLNLISGQLDPHTYELVKGDNEAFLYADLILCNGLGLEHGASLSQELEKNSKVLSLGNEILKKSREEILFNDHYPDPHIWMDISLWSQCIAFIQDRLIAIDPEHTLDYQFNAKQLTLKMEETHKQIKQLLQQVPEDRRYLVTSHDAFNYFARAYLSEPEELSSSLWKNRVQAPEGLAPEGAISLLDIQRIVDHVTRFRIPVIFPESNVSKDSLIKIVDVVKQKGFQITIAEDHLFGDNMGDPQTSSGNYLGMMLHNAQFIQSELIKGISGESQ